ncbi:class I SAM-dependent methyltransferase [Bradyrhizobium sp. WSM 1738]|uniref:class I SAM-dependent methyltransferase n=1 Tax=Bradyrhizobium hereditatis TaxID=2821405 RepID=UPI001CE34D5A|nr:class I SAM-dependent methyltransferase [Bradyrhizobium hereditatis]MCA6119991.1 class I SAM-dependent methyltransferase [Bradyrhizobium hereditatis]
MGMMDRDDGPTQTRILVAIASYGTSNDHYLERIVREYRSMSFAVDIVVLSNIDKKLDPGIDCLVGLPNKNPWSLPFAHKKLFADRCDRYDLFIYSEDDILITERSLRAWMEVNTLLASNEVAGFLRVEYGSDGGRSYPDAHANFHWDPSSVRRRGNYTLAHFTNEHAACYVLTRSQLHRALSSGGFDVPPHEGKYDLLCTAATDPYTQCGLTKLIPVSHLDAFTVHHMSNRYVGTMGVTAEEFGKQTDALMRVALNDSSTESLLPARSWHWRFAYAKDYYEPVTREVTSLIPKRARNVLSIGCGSGAIERWLVKQGLRVVAVPLDPIIASGAAVDGVEIVPASAVSQIESKYKEHFDCVLCLNVLHLAPAPQKLLSQSRAFMHPKSTLIVQSPNMMSLRALRPLFTTTPRLTSFSDYESTGAHFSSARTVRRWCTDSGFSVERTLGVVAVRGNGMVGKTSAIGDYLPGLLSHLLAPSIIVTATKVQMDSNPNGERTIDNAARTRPSGIAATSKADELISAPP